MSVGLDPAGHITQASITTAGAKFVYTLVTQGMTDDALKELIKLNGKTVDVEGTISHSRMTVTVTGGVKASKGKKTPEKEKKPAEKEKKGTSKTKGK